MSEITMERRRVPIGTIILLALVAIGLVVGITRFVQGLGATTNLTDFYPWGLWIGFDMISGVAFSSGAFTLAAIVYIFNLEKYRPVLRSSLLTGFIGYLIAIMGLIADLGRPHQIFNVLIPANWNIHSVLFEVAVCVMLYTTVMALELLPVVFERFNKQMVQPARGIRRVMVPLVILGITLSTMHQSSLGSLFLIMPDKLHPLWYTPILPILFYISAIGLGLASEIFESSLCSKVFRRGLHIDISSGLARAIPYVLGLYMVLKLGAIALAGNLGLMFEGSRSSNMFLLEIVVGAILPMVLFALPRVRRNPAGLFWTSVLVVVGTIINRLNVSLIGPQLPADLGHLSPPAYSPHWMEFAVTIGLVSGGLILFMLAVRFLPIFPEIEGEAH